MRSCAISTELSGLFAVRAQGLSHAFARRGAEFAGAEPVASAQFLAGARYDLLDDAELHATRAACGAMLGHCEPAVVGAYPHVSLRDRAACS